MPVWLHIQNFITAENEMLFEAHIYAIENL